MHFSVLSFIVLLFIGSCHGKVVKVFKANEERTSLYVDCPDYTISKRAGIPATVNSVPTDDDNTDAANESGYVITYKRASIPHKEIFSVNPGHVNLNVGCSIKIITRAKQCNFGAPIGTDWEAPIDKEVLLTIVTETPPATEFTTLDNATFPPPTTDATDSSEPVTDTSTTIETNTISPAVEEQLVLTTETPIDKQVLPTVATPITPATDFTTPINPFTDSSEPTTVRPTTTETSISPADEDKPTVIIMP